MSAIPTLAWREESFLRQQAHLLLEKPLQRGRRAQLFAPCIGLDKRLYYRFCLFCQGLRLLLMAKTGNNRPKNDK